MIPIKQKDAIKARLQERIPKLECPMCHQYSFVLLDGYLTENIQENYNLNPKFLQIKFLHYKCNIFNSFICF